MNSVSERAYPPNIVLPTLLESDRVVLRGYASSDAGTLAQVFLSNRDRLEEDFSSRFSTISHGHDAEQFVLRAMQQWSMRMDFYFGIWEKASRHFVGEIALVEIDWGLPKANVSYFVVKEAEGKGLITDALRLLLPLGFDVLGLRKIQIRCDVHNMRSQRVAERCGFKIEGVLRNDRAKSDGSLVSIVYYGMTPTDFRAFERDNPKPGVQR